MSREFERIAAIAPVLARGGGSVLVGHGDDAAVLALDGAVVVAVDVLVEGRHFRRDLSSWADVGWKALAVNVSDLAAMGATPAAAVVGLGLPAAFDDADLVRLYGGMTEAGRRWGVDLVGGDTVRAEVVTAAVTVLGTVEPGRAVTRAGAQPGDRVVVVGALGAAAAALAQDAAGAAVEPALLAAHRRPLALPAAGRVLADAGARAMLDVSDGLGADLGHLCSASGVAVRVDAAALPVAAGVVEAVAAVGGDTWSLVVGGGEDFALVAALPAEVAGDAAERAGAAEGVPAAVVGEVVAVGWGPAVALRLPDGSVRDATRLGYDHFDA